MISFSHCRYMAYDLVMDCIAFQWKGEKQEAMCQFEQMYPEITFARTTSSVLRAKYNGVVVEVSLGGFLVLPERSRGNMFFLSRSVFNKVAEPTGDLQYKIKLEGVRVFFSQDYMSMNLTELLQTADKDAFVETDKYRFSICGRYVALTSDVAIILCPGYVVTMTDEFCRLLASEHKLTLKDKRVVIDDASVIIIRTDATVIVDSAKACKIYKQDMRGKSDDFYTAIGTRGKQSGGGVAKTGKGSATGVFDAGTYTFKVYDNKNANTTIMRFIRDHKQQINVELTSDNLRVMLEYICNNINCILRKSSLCDSPQLVMSLRINKFDFVVTYYTKDRVAEVTVESDDT